MDPKELRIVYMGTPEFAIAPLEKLIAEGCTIAGVVTAPDKPAGRGKKMQSPALKTYAGTAGINVILQPEKLRDEQFIRTLKDLKPDLFIVVAFRMLHEIIWSMPPYGTFNLHASLLPQYRGAAPINHAVMNGETETGLTTFMIDREIDTGAILLQEKVGIGPEETAGELHDRLMVTGAGLVWESVKMIAAGRVKKISQETIIKEGEDLKSAPRIFRDDCRIRWSKPAAQVHNQIRGLSPYPAAFTELVNEQTEPVNFKIFKTALTDEKSTDHPGTIESDGKSFILVNTSDYKISVLSLQQAGKKRLDVTEFLRGFQGITNYYFS